MLAHGDSVIAGVKTKESGLNNGQREDDPRAFWDEVVKQGWRERCRVVSLDGRCEASSLNIQATQEQIIQKLMRSLYTGIWHCARLRLQKLCTSSGK